MTPDPFWMAIWGLVTGWSLGLLFAAWARTQWWGQ